MLFLSLWQGKHVRGKVCEQVQKDLFSPEHNCHAILSFLWRDAATTCFFSKIINYLHNMIFPLFPLLMKNNGILINHNYTIARPRTIILFQHL